MSLSHKVSPDMDLIQIFYYLVHEEKAGSLNSLTGDTRRVFQIISCQPASVGYYLTINSKINVLLLEMYV